MNPIDLSPFYDFEEDPPHMRSAPASASTLPNSGTPLNRAQLEAWYTSVYQDPLAFYEHVIDSPVINGEDCSGIHLQRATLADALWIDTSLERANLQGMNANRSQFIRCFMRNVQTSGMGFLNTTWQECNLEQGYCASTSFAYSKWQDIDGHMIRLQSADLSAANWHNVSIPAGDLSGAHCTDMYIEGGTMERCQAIGADFTNSTLRTNCSHSDFSHTKLDYVNFSGDGMPLHAILFGVNIIGTSLRGTQFASVKQFKSMHLRPIETRVKALFDLANPEQLRVYHILVQEGRVTSPITDMITFARPTAEKERVDFRYACIFLDSLEPGQHPHVSPLAYVINEWLTEH